MNLQCAVVGCVNRATCPGFSYRCKKHGGRYRCSYPECKNTAQGRGLCVKHGYKKKTCKIEGCAKKCISGGCCKEHGLSTHCVIQRCTKSVFKKKMCYCHWVLSKSSSLRVTDVMGIDLVRHHVMDYVGMNNWEHVHSFSGVCKQWRVSCLPHLSNIGITKMDGGENRKLHVDGFLRYLRLEKFLHIQCIFIPCGRAKGLFVEAIRRVCPSVRIIVHSKWLMMNGLLEEVNEGGACHQCYRVYRHDMAYIEGVNVWVQWTWDNKYQLVSEHQFVRRNIRRYRRRTDFFGR
jgi:hypothetical protein